MTNIVPDPTCLEARALYIELLKKCLTFWLWEGADGSIQWNKPTLVQRAVGKAAKVIKGDFAKGPRLSTQELRLQGRDWPLLAHTMIGLKRMDNLQFCVEEVIKNNVPGDLIETGVWRGGATIFMRGILKAYGVADRRVWVADSFEGLPRPNEEKYAADQDDKHYTMTFLAVSMEEVKSNFSRYGLLDDQVCFLKGWFKDTLPTAPTNQLAVARLDGDMYESTMDALVSLYPKLSVGGYLIVDDYGAVPACRQAVEDYRSKMGIKEPIQDIDGLGAFWQRLQ
ncbi:MAG TPA: TylF/MycF family methyltransferase [Verrucomicrobiae bacterium]|nr:TylF/MycF family methyltransferase [Verrucomicrobiae bacterium]